jgi:hypothetical protein
MEFRDANKGAVEEFLKKNTWNARIKEIIEVIYKETF